MHRISVTHRVPCYMIISILLRALFMIYLQISPTSDNMFNVGLFNTYLREVFTLLLADGSSLQVVLQFIDLLLFFG